MSSHRSLPLLPTTVVGSYPQPNWLVDHAKLLGRRMPPRVRAREVWRVPEPYLEEAQDDATVLAVRDLERAGIDILSDGDLTGGHAVAATGTMGLDGAVGDVGGVAQKAVAVRRAGARVFFVPADQRQAGAGVRRQLNVAQRGVIAVELQDALNRHRARALQSSEVSQHRSLRCMCGRG